MYCLSFYDGFTTGPYAVEPDVAFKIFFNFLLPFRWFRLLLVWPYVSRSTIVLSLYANSCTSFVLCFLFSDIYVSWYCHIYQYACFFSIFEIIIPGLFAITTLPVYSFIPQHCYIFTLEYWLQKVLPISLSFLCLVLCILNNVNVHQLCRVSLRTQSSPKWGILRVGGQWFLHVISTTGIYCHVFPSKSYIQNCLF